MRDLEARRRWKRKPEVRAKHNEYMRSYRSRPEVKAYMKKYRHTPAVKDRQRELREARARKRKLRCLEVYGEVCSKCGFDDNRALCLHHVNGNGKEHRTDRAGGDSMYRILIKLGFPPGLVTLCMNCHTIEHNLRKPVE